MDEHGIPGAVARDDLMRRVITDRVFGRRVHDNKEVLAAPRAHVTAVVPHLPAERLLLFGPTSGWGPLTEFLGVPEPLDACPHINRRKDFWQLRAPG
ncbi:sulfotransferase [Kitasatospora purpeofusca]|uniref:sulfotransferase n=1 Tax=Kitasatospora purpeofusca TaxID=67352 RepID=UPI0038208F6D